MWTRRLPLVIVGAPARASRAGAVPRANVAMMAPAATGDPVENAYSCTPG